MVIARGRANLKKADFDFLHGVETGRHLYQFYKSPKDYLNILTDFFSSGLEKGDACIWLISEKMGISRVRQHLLENIPGFENYAASGRMQLLSAEKWYLRDGRFDEDQALRLAAEAASGIHRLGCERLRGAGDAAAIPHEQWAELHAYEEKIPHALRSIPCILLCAYPILDCSIADTRTVLRNHDGVLIGRLD